jgi:hypothetical protein
MKKRSAILLAGAVVASMLTGAVWLSASTAPSIAEAKTQRVTPRVRTVHRTVTIHRTASPSPTIVRTASAPSVTVTSGSGEGSDNENESENETESHEGADDAQESFSSSGQGETGDD